MCANHLSFGWPCRRAWHTDPTWGSRLCCECYRDRYGNDPCEGPREEAAGEAVAAE